MIRQILTVLIFVCLGIGAFLMWPQGRAPMLVTGATAAPSNAVAGAYNVFFTLENPGPPDALVSVASEADGTVSLVRPDIYDATPIPAQSNVSFSSDGVFLRFQPDGAALAEGMLIPITLEFATGGAVRMKATLQAPQDGQMDHGAMDHGSMDQGAMDHATMPMSAHVKILDLQVLPDADAGGWDVSVTTENFEFFKPEPGADVPDTAGQGHAHLYLNGLKLGRMYLPTAQINALPKGKYAVEVALNSNTHAPYMADGKPVAARALIEVD